ncbi:MAG: hypothetical protein RJA07_1690 [Bacteroidota bacterium]|jgi:hypothetical protein
MKRSLPWTAVKSAVAKERLELLLCEANNAKGMSEK